ncbi:AAA family ATPase [Rubellimicrobium arenae]|uniref:AAA family ATPase n=1 Tax=Rubellimicrobium arenae TaxID=2817372 RepID=UPI001B306BA0|nr:AAA family ATPase [Rubellimicrobium arenae]
MAGLRLRLLGTFEARLDDRPITFPTRHSAFLLAWLALSPDRAHPRDRVAGLFWPDRSDEQARTSLRQALYRLRAALDGADPQPIQAGSRTILLNSAALQSDLAAIEAVNPRDGQALAEVVRQAGGDLLEGFEGTSPELDTWLLTERARVRRLLAERFSQLATLLTEARRFDEVEALARRQLALDPFDEAALQRLMSAAAHQGRRNAALAAFRAHADRLRDELSAAPEEATVALWRDIKAGRMAPAEHSPSEAVSGQAKPPGGTTPATPAEPHASTSPVEQRRLAVLHLSAPGVGAHLTGLDPEEATLAAAAVVRHLEKIVRRHKPCSLKTSTGELTACFALEERPALSATRAALEASAATGAWAGVHAGASLAGGSDEMSLLGLIARRLAETGSGAVLLCENARAECDGYLLLESGPSLMLPGAARPVPTWHATGATGARNSWQARACRGLSPFVGRGAELDTLRQALGRSEAGATAVLLSGEAGVGKSRLIHEFLSGPEVLGHRVLETGAAAFQTDAGHSALGTLLRCWTGLDPAAAPDLAWAALRSRLTDLGAPAALDPPLRMLLDLPVRDDVWSSLAGGQKRRRVVQALGTLLELETQARPVVLVVEDAHWLDAESAPVLDDLLMGCRAAGVLMLVSARPDYRPSWSQLSFARVLRLEGLGPEDTARLLEGISPERKPTTHFAAQLHGRTGGVPLFVEEVMHDLRRPPERLAGDTLAEDAQIPASLRGLLGSRIDRLPAGQRHLLQAASIIGPIVSETLLRGLADIPSEAMEEALDGLASAELLYRVRSHPEREFAFKHALTQEAAYQSLLRSRRQELHRRLLRLLEDGQTEAPVEDLARHAHFGAVWDKAARYGTRAGERAMARSAHPAARRHFERSLEAIGRLPQDDDTRRMAVDLRIRLRPVLMLVGDYGRVLETLDAAEREAEALRDLRRLVEIRTHIAFFRATDGSFDQGLAASLLAIDGARRLGEPILLAEATLARGELLRRRGDYAGAILALEEHLDVWSGANKLHRGINIGTRSVFARGHLATCYAYLGRRNEAREVISAARAIADETGRPVDLQFAFLHDGIVTELEGRVAESIPLFEAALDVARMTELPFFEDWILVELGEALLALGDNRRALSLLEAACARPAQRVVPQFLALARVALGKALVLAGRTEAAKAVLGQVLDYARSARHRQLEQMALRRSAMAIVSQDPTHALRLLDQAVAVAEASGLTLGLAKSLEVQTAVLRDLGRHDEAAALGTRAAAVRQSLRLPAWEGRSEPVG